MSDFRASRTARRKRPLDGTLRQSSAPPIWTILGFAHVILGAVMVFSFINTAVFGADVSTPSAALFLMVLQGVVAIGLVLPGLWLSDGRKRGAVVVCAVDVLLCVLNVVGGKLFSLDVLVLAVLAGASIWVLPMLEAEAAAKQRPSASVPDER